MSDCALIECDFGESGGNLVRLERRPERRGVAISRRNPHIQPMTGQGYKESRRDFYGGGHAEDHLLFGGSFQQ